jgi:antitoxin HigA-1
MMAKRMLTSKKSQDQSNEDFVELTIGSGDTNEWSEAKAAEIAALAKAHHAGRSPERIRKNAMLAVQYRMEHYIGNDSVTAENMSKIEDFVKEFLVVLNINKTAFARFIDIDISNLNKYYSNDRRFSTELALKFGHFFHTPPNIWLQIQAKNEILILQQEEKADDKYAKYDYEKLLKIA